MTTGRGDDNIRVTVAAGAQSYQPVFNLTDAAGSDSVNLLLATDPGQLPPLSIPSFPLVQAFFYDRANYAGSGNRSNTTWTVASDGLSAGNLELFRYYSAETKLNLDGGDDVVQVNGTSGATAIDLGGGEDTVTVGAGDLASLGGALTLTNVGLGSTLRLNDTASPSAALVSTRSISVTPTTIRPVNQPINYTASSFQAVNLLLGSANDRISLSGALPGGRISSGDGNDVLSLTLGRGELQFDPGAGQDILTLDRSDATQPLNGSLAGDGSVNLTGLAKVITAPAATPAEFLRVVLGSGNDTFDVNSAGYNPTGVSLVGGRGDDLFTISSVGGPTGSFQILVDSDLSTVGDTAQNTVRLIAPNPVANQFAPIVPRVQQLIVDHSSGTAPVGWVTKGTTVYAGSLLLVDADGANRIELQGRTAGGDTLDAQGSSVDRPVQLTLNGNRADVFEGLNVLSQTIPTAPGVTQETTAAGLNDIRPVATASAVGLIFTVDSGRIAVFRSDGPGGALLFVNSFDFGNVGDTRSLAATPNGRLLFRSNHFAAQIFDVDPITGAMQVGRVVLGGTPVVSPDGTILALGGSGLTGYF